MPTYENVEVHMYRGRFFGMLVFLMVFALILGICGFSAWSQGFSAGQLAADGEAIVVPPMRVGYGFAPFAFGFGLLFKFACLSFIFLMMIGLTGKFLRLWYWRSNGGHGHKHW